MSKSGTNFKLWSDTILVHHTHTHTHTDTCHLTSPDKTPRLHIHVHIHSLHPAPRSQDSRDILISYLEWSSMIMLTGAHSMS